MGKNRRSYPKSANRLKIQFKPNATMYEKTIQDENMKNTIKIEFKPTLPNEPTIKSITRIKEEE